MTYAFVILSLSLSIPYLIKCKNNADLVTV